MFKCLVFLIFIYFVWTIEVSNRDLDVKFLCGDTNFANFSSDPVEAGQQKNAIGNAMAMCKDYFAKYEKGQIVGKFNQSNSVISWASNCNLSLDQNSCSKCVNDTVELIWVCNTLYAKVWNKQCLIEYNYSSNSPHIDDNKEENKEKSSILLYIVLSIIIGFTFLILIYILKILISIQSRNRSDSSDHLMEEENSNQNSDLNSGSDRRMIRLPLEFFLDYYWIEESWLEKKNMIGSGNFSDVHYGLLKLPDAEGCYPVAIKTIRNTGNKFVIKSFVEEAKRMKKVGNHENVLPLIGICVKLNMPMIVLPFMSNGDLLSYIRSENKSLTFKQLFYFSIDVAKGMYHLSSLHHIHRDLAARNCMVDENLTIKIADFGLCRELCDNNYYYRSNNRKEIPIKWTAPESIEKNISLVKSDVWSYGVLLWELMTRGDIPYSDLDGYQVLEFIKSGNRLPKPERCIDQIYELMLDCFKLNPNSRPTFDQIIERIRFLIKREEKQLNVVTNLNEVAYVNYPVKEYYLKFDEKFAS